MTPDLEILRMAQALAAHASRRQTVIAGNIANADTPGYKSSDIAPFSEVYESAPGLELRTSRPGHLTWSDRADAALEPMPAGGAQSPDGNTVSLDVEMTRAAEVRQDYELALGVFGKSIDILRASLGRR